MGATKSLTVIIWLMYYSVYFDVGQTEVLAEENYHDLTNKLNERYLNISQAIYEFKRRLNFNAHVLAEDTYHGKEDELRNNLTDNLPSCSEETIYDLMNSLEDLILNTNPKPCYQDLKFIDNITNTLWDWATSNIETNMDILHSCSTNTSCDYRKQHLVTELKINELDERFNKDSSSELSDEWNKVKLCYNQMMNGIMDKISNIHFTPEECASVHDYEDILSAASLWPLTMEKFVGVSVADAHQNLPEQSRHAEVQNLTAELNQINYDVFELTEELGRSTGMLLEEMKGKLNHKLSKYTELVDHLPSCYKHFMKDYREKSIGMLNDTRDNMCGSYDVNDCTSSILNEDFTHVRPILGKMDRCEINENQCNYAATHIYVMQKISELKENLTTCRKNHKKNVENEMRVCYDQLIWRVERRLMKYLSIIENCNKLKAEVNLFAKMGLVKFIDKEFDDENLSPARQVHPLGVQDNKILRNRMDEFLLDLRNYGYHLKHQMRTIFKGFNESMMSDYDTMMKVIGDKMYGSAPTCFREKVVSMRESLSYYYANQVYNRCYDPLPKLLFNSSIILSSRASEMDVLLRKTPDCQLREYCDQATSIITRESMKLKKLHKYNLTISWEYAKKCFYQASFHIKYNIMRQENQLRNCEEVKYQKLLFQHIEKNQDAHPSFDIDNHVDISD